MLPGASRLSSAILVLVRLMESLGIDVQARFNELGIDYQLLHDPSARFPDKAVISLWETLAEKSQDPCVGLRAGDFWHPTSFHALGFAWMASATLKEAFERLVRYNGFITTNQTFEFVETDSHFRFIIQESAPPYEFPDIFYDAAVSFVITLCEEAYGKDFSFLRVDLKRTEPGCAEQFRSRFRAPIVFSADSNTLYLSKELALSPLPTANAELARINEGAVDHYLKHVQQGSLSRQVMNRLIEQLPSGHASQESVASSLFMSPRTLQRKLHEEQTSYKQLLTETRTELARQYLETSDAPVSEIAYLLGFSEVGNFTRAFRRWTGVAPSEYRAQQ